MHTQSTAGLGQHGRAEGHAVTRPRVTLRIVIMVVAGALRFTGCSSNDSTGGSTDERSTAADGDESNASPGQADAGDDADSTANPDDDDDTIVDEDADATNTDAAGDETVDDEPAVDDDASATEDDDGANEAAAANDTLLAAISRDGDREFWEAIAADPTSFPDHLLLPAFEQAADCLGGLAEARQQALDEDGQDMGMVELLVEGALVTGTCRLE